MKTNRRQFLRGLGTTLALPCLPSLLPRAAWATEPAEPQRFMLFFAPNGAQMAHWVPDTVGPAYTAPQSLAPLAPVRDDVLVLSGLDNAPGNPNHTSRTRALFAARLQDSPYGERFGATLDQTLVPHLAGNTPYPTLAVGSEASTACSTAQCTWLYNLSWTEEFVPVTKDISTRSVFERLFGAGQAEESEADRLRRLAEDRSVLDAVLGDLASLRPRLSTADGIRLDQHLTGVRALERRLVDPEAQGLSCDGGSPPATTFDPTEQVRQMLDLVVLALSCDQSRVVSYMLGAAESYRPLAFLGHATDHHTASHFFPQPHLAATSWSVEQYAYLLQQLAADIRPDGSRLLDHTFVLYASGISDALNHSRTNLPVLLGGRGGVAAPTGQHVALPANTPMANLGVSLLQAYGVPTTQFGLGSTGSALSLTG